ncbi:hypothetical protein B0H10DRAFT_1952973 [Mycena sp. CBHHK59/15]|nr:hypothetical protein B0H10DRAFT_1952973 [Mycena sp. CBHHK59/15]
MFDFMNYGPDPGGHNGTVLEYQTGGPDGDDDGLEYIGPPYVAPAPLYANGGDMDVSVIQSAFNKLSQELPPLLSLPTSYDSYDDPDEHTTNVFDDIQELVAPQDIDLELEKKKKKKKKWEGKRKRTQYTRATDAKAAGPTKKSSRHR